MAGLQVLLEDGQLKISRKLRESATLVRELTDIRLSPRSGGHVGMGADGCSRHDDLALAVALACWRARRLEIGFGTQRLALGKDCMSVSSYFGKAEGSFENKIGDERSQSVDDALAVEARRAWRLGGRPLRVWRTTVRCCGRVPSWIRN